MGSLVITDKTIEKYFDFLTKLDNRSKKKLIIKLTESLDVNDKSSFDLKTIFGAWEDIKDSDEIIKQIRTSRVDYRDIEEF